MAEEMENLPAGSCFQKVKAKIASFFRGINCTTLNMADDFEAPAKPKRQLSLSLLPHVTICSTLLIASSFPFSLVSISTRADPDLIKPSLT